MTTRGAGKAVSRWHGDVPATPDGTRVRGRQVAMRPALDRPAERAGWRAGPAACLRTRRSRLVHRARRISRVLLQDDVRAGGRERPVRPARGGGKDAGLGAGCSSSVRRMGVTLDVQARRRHVDAGHDLANNAPTPYTRRRIGLRGRRDGSRRGTDRILDGDVPVPGSRSGDAGRMPGSRTAWPMHGATDARWRQGCRAAPGRDRGGMAKPSATSGTKVGLHPTDQAQEA